MAHSVFTPSVIKAPLKDAIKNIQKAIEIQKAREGKKKTIYGLFSFHPAFRLLYKYRKALGKLRRIATLAFAAQTSITITASEYNLIKHWEAWKE